MSERAAPALALLLALAAHAGCGGGGGGRSGGGGPTTPPTPTPPPPSIGFTATGTGGIGSLALTRISSDATTLVLSLEATSVTDLYGVAFDLVYPSAALELDDVDEGTFLEEGGAAYTTLQVAERPGGTVVVGLTRLGQVPGRSGTGSLLRFTFGRLAAGGGEIRFENARAFDGDGDVIATVTFSGGTVSVP